MNEWLGRASQCGDAVSKSAFGRSIVPVSVSVFDACDTCPVFDDRVSVFDDRGWMDDHGWMTVDG